MKINKDNLLEAIDYINSLEDYQVLKKINSNSLKFNSNDLNEPIRKAIYLDCESTGLDFDNDLIIELGFLVFNYGLNSGTIFEIEQKFNQFEDPGFPIPENISKITGIYDKDVKDQKFDEDLIKSHLKDISLIIAHNARFDRNMVEKRLPFFKDLPWACSQKDINWLELGMEGIKLEYLLLKFGYFYSAHRAINDCFAGLNLLNQDLAQEKVMAVLLKKARSNSFIIRALNSPFHTKDILRQRGYSWHAGGIDNNKFWWIEIDEQNYQEELDWLSENVYQSQRAINLANIPGAISKINAKQRHRNFDNL